MRNGDDTPKGLGIDIFAHFMERANRRQFIMCIILAIALIATNLAWTIYYSQYSAEIVTIEADQEADGLGRNYVIGGDYGDETESKNN